MYVFVVDGEIESDKLIKFAYRYFIKVKNLEEKKDIEIIRERGAKPRLNDERVYFSLSDSNTIKAIAISEYNVGLDIEWGKERDYNKFKFIEGKTKDAFYTDWTKHEAYYKYLGVGLKKEKLDDTLTYETFKINGGYYLATCCKKGKVKILNTTPSQLRDGLGGIDDTRQN